MLQVTRRQPNPPAGKEKFIDALYSDRDYYVKEFDKGITFIATAIFGVSFAFIEKIVKLDTATDVGVLITGWILLAVAIVLSVANHYINLHVVTYQIRNYSKRKEMPQKSYVKRYDRVIHVINIMNMVLTITGTILIIVFINLNLNL